MEEYFQAQASIGRYFCEWNLDWIAESYYSIVQYIKENNLSSN